MIKEDEVNGPKRLLKASDPCKGCLFDSEENILACVACVLKEKMAERRDEKVMTKEMKSLRRMLDEKGIEWIDASSPVLSDHEYQIYRTHFSYRGYKWSVIHGYGTYGGYSPLDSIDFGLLELMSDAVNDGNPIGWLTAEEAMEYIKGGKEWKGAI